MIMGDRNLNIILALVGLCMCLSTDVNADEEKRDCNCRGPTKYYEELKCKPVFQNSSDCCPIRYNCDLWTELTENQCIANGHIYNLGERLRPEDRNPCDSCICIGRQWTCLSSSCYGLIIGDSYGRVQECYLKRDAFQCCPGPTACVQEGERPTCLVDGKTYKDGELFIPLNEPEKRCYCGEGYVGENVEPFCASPNRTWCNNVIKRSYDIFDNCAPVYNHDQSLQTDCNLYYSRCQNENDVVINPKPNKPTDSDMLCKFGNMTLQIGEELNRNTDWTSACLKCVCEVPPVLSCQRVSKEECDPKEHGGS